MQIWSHSVFAPWKKYKTYVRQSRSTPASVVQHFKRRREREAPALWTGRTECTFQGDSSRRLPARGVQNEDNQLTSVRKTSQHDPAASSSSY